MLSTSFTWTSSLSAIFHVTCIVLPNWATCLDLAPVGFSLSLENYLCAIPLFRLLWWLSHLPMQETRVRSLGSEDPLEKEMATHSSILAWRIPWTEDLAGYSLWGCKRVGLSN